MKLDKDKIEMINIEYSDFIMQIDPTDGMNICYLKWKESTIIVTDEKRRAIGLTYGVPILFPTPNRTANDLFVYKGSHYPGRMHGLIRKLPFTITCNEETEDGYMIVGTLNWNEDNNDYIMFPFNYSISIKIRLSGHQIFYSYEVINLGIVNMPYGFGIHPFFNNSRGDACISTPALQVLKTEKKINTGEIIDAKNTVYDLRNLKQVKDLKLDTIYLTETPDKAIICWSDIQIALSATDDFSHIVIYTPENYESFCVEPQTCSNDAMNLFDRGYEKVSGMIEVQTNEKKYGTIIMTLSETNQ